MYERVNPVDECHQRLIPHKVLLDRQFPENVQPFFGRDYFESMLFRAMNRPFHYPDRCCSSTELVNLSKSVYLTVFRVVVPTQYIKNQYQHSTKNGKF